jgi:hypothetical protein
MNQQIINLLKSDLNVLMGIKKVLAKRKSEEAKRAMDRIDDLILSNENMIEQLYDETGA